MPNMILVAVMLLWALPATAQREFNVWWFGSGAGIDFNFDPPRPIATSMQAFEGVATISDPTTGLLLMATNGVVVRNRVGDVMPHGSNIGGHINSTQSALIVPMPGQADRYYVFTSDAGAYATQLHTGVSYVVVDMRLDGGLGDIDTALGRTLLLSSACEKLAAIRAADGCSFWVVAHGWGNNLFYAFRVDNNGVAPAVVSRTGAIHADPVGETGGYATVGEMSFSPDGHYLAVAAYTLSSFQLFDFDATTGGISERLSLPDPGSDYGVAFSPNSRFLYVSLGRTSYTILQYDLAAGNTAAVTASRYVVQSGSSAGEYFGALELGADSAIYAARIGSKWLGVIARPDRKGDSCAYNHFGFNLSAVSDTDNTSNYGLPNIIQGVYGLPVRCVYPIAAFALPDTILCAGSCIHPVEVAVNSATEWRWEFPGSGSPDATTRDPGPVCYNTPGIYTITLKVSNQFGSDTIQRSVVVLNAGRLRTHLGEGSSVAEKILLPIIVDEATGLIGMQSLVVEIRLPPRSLRLVDVRTDNTLTDSWGLDYLARDHATGIYRFRLVPPPSDTLQASGPLADLVLEVFLDSLLREKIAFEILTESATCINVSTDSGWVDLPWCSPRNRLIELIETTDQITRIAPNPIDNQAFITFTTIGAGNVKITLHAIDGGVATTLFNGALQAGEHTIPFSTETLGAGAYCCRIEYRGRILSRWLVIR